MKKTRVAPSSSTERHASAGLSPGSIKRLGLSLAIAALVSGPQISLAQQAPICVDPPPIGGPPGVGVAPAGWSVAQNTPDIISGNGLWPGGGYTVSDITGTSTSGGTMGLFLNQDPGYVESWQTTLTGLTAGVTYQVAIEWQQATLAQNGGGSLWSGGQIRLTVDGNSTGGPCTSGTKEACSVPDGDGGDAGDCVGEHQCIRQHVVGAAGGDIQRRVWRIQCNPAANRVKNQLSGTT